MVALIKFLNKNPVVPSLSWRFCRRSFLVGLAGNREIMLMVMFSSHRGGHEATTPGLDKPESPASSFS